MVNFETYGYVLVPVLVERAEKFVTVEKPRALLTHVCNASQTFRHTLKHKDILTNKYTRTTLCITRATQRQYRNMAQNKETDGV